MMTHARDLSAQSSSSSYSYSSWLLIHIAPLGMNRTQLHFLLSGSGHVTELTDRVNHGVISVAEFMYPRRAEPSRRAAAWRPRGIAKSQRPCGRRFISERTTLSLTLPRTRRIVPVETRCNYSPVSAMMYHAHVSSLMPSQSSSDRFVFRIRIGAVIGRDVHRQRVRDRVAVIATWPGLTLPVPGSESICLWRYRHDDV